LKAKGEKMGNLQKFKFSALATVALVALSGVNAQAQDFKGYTLKVKLIGGTQYEQLYSVVIPVWEKRTGGKVEILSRKNHFELDKEIKQDIAAKNIDYCVASNHTSFAPQYGQIYRDLKSELPSSHLNKFGKLVMEKL
jgi:multiple sugar transport system substrate-binding protein